MEVCGEVIEEGSGCAAGLVVGVSGHGVGELHELAVDFLADDLVEDFRRPRRSAFVKDKSDELFSADGLAVCPGKHFIDDGFGAAAVDELLKHAPGGRTPLWCGEGLDETVFDDGLGVLRVDGAQDVGCQAAYFATNFLGVVLVG